MSGTVPFLRWAGGKRWIARRLAPLIREILQGRFIEPFLGSGAMFFAVDPTDALLSDLNAQLINVYRQIKRHSAEIELALKRMRVDAETYYEIRASIPASRIQHATRFIYLNRTCFGGLHRTNQRGEFNVPYGGGSRTPEPVYRDHLLQLAGCMLRRKGVRLATSDFESVVNSAGPGDVVFCDPTYRSAGRGRFDRYGPVIFSWDDQRRLLQASQRARDRGAVVIVMNIDEREIRGLYRDALLVPVSKMKSIGNRSKQESAHKELIAVSDPFGREDHWIALETQQQRACMQGAA